ncbi:MAG: hypothetical protein VKJ24_13960, partial [Synechococcales bacterium]|nr:hypothetical protein [Synechococcales bacterium]
MLHPVFQAPATQSPAPSAETAAPAWDLSDLYQGFDDPQWEQDLATLQQAAQEFRDRYRGQISTLAAETIALGLRTLEEIYEKLGYLYAFPSLIFAADTQNTAAKQATDKALEAYTAIQNQLLFFDLELKQLDPAQFTTLQAAIELQPYRHYLAQIAKYRPHALSEAVEQTRNQDSLTGREAFIQLRSVHLGEQNYDPVTTPEGQTAATEAELSALAYSPDRQTRTAAYQSIRQVMQQHNSLYAYILSTVAQDHKLENQMRGHASTLAKQLLADEVSEPVFRAIMSGTGDRFDLFQRYYHLKGKALGEKTRTADLYAPWGTDSSGIPAIPYQAGVETLLQALSQFDVNYARRAEEFFLKNWVDAKVNP